MSTPTVDEYVRKKSKPRKGALEGIIIIACFSFAVWAAHKSGLALGMVTEQISAVEKSLQTYKDYRTNTIDYKTTSYVLGGRGSQPSGFDLALLQGIQRAEGDLQARDKSLLSALKGKNSLEIAAGLESGRDLFDEEYRKTVNAATKKLMSESLYNKLLNDQITTLTDAQLKQMKACYEVTANRSGYEQMYDFVYSNRPEACDSPAESDKNIVVAPDQSGKVDAVQTDAHEMSLMLSNGERKIVKVIDAEGKVEDNKASKLNDSKEATDDLHAKPAGEQQPQP
ncbi:hypothetical protein RYA05_02675 [Pseudomonas syringae pv. actinidiae]|nr:hypothetical protein [Pseudomonas syringae pv. actinidiae]